MLFNILKLFGLDVPAKIEAVKASLERRVEQATDHIKQVAQEAAVIAALSAVAIVTAFMAVGVGLIALYFWTANAYGMYAGLGVVGAILVVVTVALAVAAAVKARSLSSTGITPQRTTAGTAAMASDPALIENAAAAEAAATQLRSDVIAPASDADAPASSVAPASAAAARPAAPMSSARDLVEPLAYLLPKVVKFPTIGNPAVDELIGNLAATARGTADEAVNRAANVIRQGNRANLVVVLTGAAMVGWMLARHSRR
jgi:hypothetical protein